MNAHSTLRDAKGRSLRLRQLNWGETLPGAIEGDPAEFSRDFRERLARTIKEESPVPALLFDRPDEKTLPRHHGVARVDLDGRTTKVYWFHDKGDPFLVLSELLREVDLDDVREVHTREPGQGAEGAPLSSWSDRKGTSARVTRLHWQETHLNHPDPEPKKTWLLVMNDLNKIMQAGSIPGKLVQTREHREAFPAPEARKEGVEPTAILPPETAVAYLRSDWTRNEDDWFTHLSVGWFQDPSNPLERLRDLLKEVDWETTAKGWYP